MYNILHIVVVSGIVHLQRVIGISNGCLFLFLIRTINEPLGESCETAPSAFLDPVVVVHVQQSIVPVIDLPVRIISRTSDGQVNGRRSCDVDLARCQIRITPRVLPRFQRFKVRGLQEITVISQHNIVTG